MSIYGAFGVRPIINGAGPATRLGGTIMDDEVLEAMAQAGERTSKSTNYRRRQGGSSPRSPALKPAMSPGAAAD